MMLNSSKRLHRKITQRKLLSVRLRSQLRRSSRAVDMSAARLPRCQAHIVTETKTKRDSKDTCSFILHYFQSLPITLLLLPLLPMDGPCGLEPVTEPGHKRDSSSHCTDWQGVVSDYCNDCRVRLQTTVAVCVLRCLLGVAAAMTTGCSVM